VDHLDSSGDNVVIHTPVAQLSKEQAKGNTMNLTLPTKAQVAVFVAEAGTVFVFVNDFVKADHITGWPLAAVNAAAVVVTAISHWNNKRKAATQAKTTTTA
jgi:hypothetical protein